MGGGKALVAGPLKKTELFFGLPLLLLGFFYELFFGLNSVGITLGMMCIIRYQNSCVQRKKGKNIHNLSYRFFL